MGMTSWTFGVMSAKIVVDGSLFGNYHLPNEVTGPGRTDQDSDSSCGRLCVTDRVFALRPPWKSPSMPKLYCNVSEGLRKAEATVTVSEYDGTPQHFPL